jgi:hypothetical protein
LGWAFPPASRAGALNLLCKRSIIAHPLSARSANAFRASAVKGVGALVLAILGPGRLTLVGQSGKRVEGCFDTAPEDEGRAIGPCELVGINVYLGVGAAKAVVVVVVVVPIVVGGVIERAGVATTGSWSESCVLPVGGEEVRCKKAGRRDTGEVDRVIVTFPPRRAEIWSSEGS